MKKKWIGLAIVGLGLAALGVAVAQRADSTIDKRAQMKPAVDRPPAVEVATVTARTFQPTVRATGELLPLREVKVFPKVGGTVLTIGPELGDPVKAGDTLATLEADQIGAQAAQAAAQRRAASTAVAQARVQRDAAKVELERAKTLQAANALPKAEVDRAQTAYDSAVAAVNAASAQVAVARAAEETAALSVGWTTVTSPIDGAVTRRLVDVGAMVGPQAPIYEIQDASELELEVSVPPGARDILAVGDPAEFTVDGLGGRAFSGRVVALSPTLDPATRRFRVKIRADGAQPGLMAHMFAAVTLPTGPAQTAPAAPRNALIDLEEGPSAFLVGEGDIAQRVDARPDLTDADWIALSGDAAVAGARVVVRGQGLVRAGAPVTVVEAGDGRVVPSSDVKPPAAAAAEGAK